MSPRTLLPTSFIAALAACTPHSECPSLDAGVDFSDASGADANPRGLLDGSPQGGDASSSDASIDSATDASTHTLDAGEETPFFGHEVVFTGVDSSGLRCADSWCVAATPGSVIRVGVYAILLSVEPEFFEVTELEILGDDGGYWEVESILSPLITLADARPEFHLTLVELRLAADAPLDTPPAGLRLAIQRVGGEVEPRATEVRLEVSP